MLSHLETGNLVIASFLERNVTIIHAKDPALFLRDTGLSESVIAPSSLVATKSDTGYMSTEVDTGKICKSSPSAANIQHLVSRLEPNLLADNGEFVILELFESFLFRRVRDNTRRVNHAWAKEPAVEVITSVVVVANLLLVYSALEVVMSECAGVTYLGTWYA